MTEFRMNDTYDITCTMEPVYGLALVVLTARVRS